VNSKEENFEDFCLNFQEFGFVLSLFSLPGNANNSIKAHDRRFGYCKWDVAFFYGKCPSLRLNEEKREYSSNHISGSRRAEIFFNVVDFRNGLWK
jgi:hypothetical protein